MFSDETQIFQFYVFCRHVPPPSKKRGSPRYFVPTVKKAAKVMVWGAICENRSCGLWFIPEGISINGTVYLNVLKEKLPIFMKINRCTHFQDDGVPCHQTKAVKKWLGDNEFQILGP